ncbi:PTS transporter subunit EIIC [Paratractidigestivibacter sp.]|uniref:PTS transporter subunit EIIC n=1 Tax=Paratractidigestivibacter sp. TaxID=2847316 RepID=UPI002AC89F7B|nr:PTS transporter subunit EIIC [Paratractidigestivibacter sp.]
MAKDYTKLAATIVELVGGEQNVSSVTHCITRLRFKLKDESLAQTERLNQTEGVISILKAAGQYQVVIGNHVTDVYDAIPKVSNIELGGEVEAEEEGGNLLNRAINLLSGIFMPMLPAMSAAGLLKAFVIMFNTLGVLDSASTTYQLLYAMGDAVFYFMPIFLGRTAAKKFHCNDWTAMAIAAFLCYPTLTTLYNGTDPVDLFGLPVTLISYTSSVLPIIVAVYVQSWVEKGLNKIVPDMLKGLLVPICTLFVACVATLFVVGPVTDFVGRAIANALSGLLATVPLVAGFLIGALWPCLIIFGMHWGFIPIIMSNIGTLGYDVILPITVGTNFAVGFAALAVFLKTKNPELKETAAASTISALFAGITEPAIYGVVLKYKRPFVIMALSCGVCGAIAATGGLTQAALMTTCLLTIPAIGGMVGWLDVIALAIASVITFVCTLIFGFSDEMLLTEDK